MRRDEKEITDQAALDAIIRESTVCRLGLVDGKEPYVVPVCFGYEDKVLYFHCALEGRKIDVLRANPNVCVEFDIAGELEGQKVACGWGIGYRSVIGFGKAVFIEVPDEKRRALRAIMAHYSDRHFEFEENVLSKTAVIGIEIESMTGKQAEA